MRRLLIALALGVFATPSLYAQCSGGGSHTLPDLQTTTVQACFNSVNTDGTTIILPAGSIIWTTGASVTFSNSVVIQGAGAISATTGGASTTGTDQTKITDHVPGTSHSILNLTVPASKSLRVTGIAIIQDSTSVVAGNGLIGLGGASTSVRIDHNHFFSTVNGTKHVVVNGSVLGVADHNFNQANPSISNDYAFFNGQGWLGDTGSNGDKSWNDTSHFGTSQFFFVEDTQFSNGWAGDCVDGGRYVHRHNTYNSIGGTANHGTTFFERSCRAMEIYQNTYNGGAASNFGNDTFSNNGGASLYWGNTVATGYQFVLNTDIPRKNNNFSGCCAVPPTGWGYCGTAFNGTGSAWDQNTVASTGYACMDQPARGRGDLLSGDLPTTCNITLNPACNIFTGQYPRQDLDPIYIWNITFSSPSILLNEQSGRLTANKDYYIQTSPFTGATGVGSGLQAARPATCTTGVGYWASDAPNPQDAAHPGVLFVCGPTNTWTTYYTPFTYPHPLAAGGIVPPPPPNSPTGLAATVSASTVSLSWTASSGSPAPTAYTLYRGTVHGGPYSIVKSGLTSTSTTDTPPNGTWFYTVAAYVGGVVSNISGSGSAATVTCTTSCAFPTGSTLTVGGNSNSSFNVTTNSTSQPTSSTFTFASSTGGTGTGGGAWQTASESPKSNEITATVPAALTATFLPASRTFASQTVGTSSASQSFTFSNTSGPGGTITISGKALSGANPGDYSFTDNCPSLLLSGLNCTANVTFTPTAAGTRNATLAFTDNATGSPQSVAMTGTGVAQAPGVSLNPTSLNFGDQTLSTTSTARSIILTNTGSGALTITSVVASGDFAVVTVPATNCGGTLASLATCSLNVTFTPTATGGRTGAITVTDNASGSPHVATLSGVGINTKCQMTGNVTLSGPGSVCQ